MKALPEALSLHLATGATTLCWCWRLTRADGTRLGFTDHDRDLTFDGTTFEAAAGFTASEMRDALGEHTVATAYEQGWSKLDNGLLLQEAEGAFDALDHHRQELAASAQPERSSIGHSGPADDELACNPPAPRARRRCC